MTEVPPGYKAFPFTLSQRAVQLLIASLLMHAMATTGRFIGNELIATESAEELMRICGMWADEDNEEPGGG